MKNSPSSSISTNAASDKALDLQGNFVVPCFSRTKKRHLLQLLISAGAHLFPGHVKFILLKGLEFSGFIHDEILKHAWFNPVPPCDLPLYGASLLDFVQKLDFRHKVERMMYDTGHGSP